MNSFTVFLIIAAVLVVLGVVISGLGPGGGKSSRRSRGGGWDSGPSDFGGGSGDFGGGSGDFGGGSSCGGGGGGGD